MTVDTLTEFYARYPGLPSRFRNDTAPGQQTGRLSARPSPPSVAISVGTTPMIAIPVAAFMGSLAMIVGPAPQPWCNDFGHARPMIAIPPADDCGSLQIEAAAFSVIELHPLRGLPGLRFGTLHNHFVSGLGLRGQSAGRIVPGIGAPGRTHGAPSDTELSILYQD